MKGGTVILANGDFPALPHSLRILQEAERIVCCDGAAQALLAHAMEPTVVIGDLDSLNDNVKERLRGRIIQVAEQDTNDLNKAFRYCLSQGWLDITILGATGKREDHTLGNISLLADFAKQAPAIRMVTDYGCFLPMLASGTISCTPGQQVSIFALDSDTPIVSHGLKYPLNGLAPHRWWEATLNEALGDSFTLDFPEGKSLLLFLAWLV